MPRPISEHTLVNGEPVDRDAGGAPSQREFTPGGAGEPQGVAARFRDVAAAVPSLGDADTSGCGPADSFP